MNPQLYKFIELRVHYYIFCGVIVHFSYFKSVCDVIEHFSYLKSVCDVKLEGHSF